jgi:uncharacterized membrane protein YphA (DoxX/SURF4 family)
VREKARKISTNRVSRQTLATLCLRLAIGGLFIYSGAVKLSDMALFSAMVEAYQILPLPLVNLFALAMPWLEVTAGLALVSNRLPLGGPFVIGGLLAIFIAALSYTLLLGRKISCGCFGVDVPVTWTLVGQDALLLLGCGFLFFHACRGYALPHTLASSEAGAPATAADRSRTTPA